MYKYNLLERFDKLNQNDRIIFWDWAPGQLHKSKETIRGWLYIKADDSKEIGMTPLLKLSIFFQCRPEDLYTRKIDRDAIVESIKKHSNHVYRRN